MIFMKTQRENNQLIIGLKLCVSIPRLYSYDPILFNRFILLAVGTSV